MPGRHGKCCILLVFTPRGGARQNDGGYPNDIFPRFFRQRDVRKFGPRDAVFTSIQRRSTGVDFSPLEQANESLLHALTVVGFIRFPLATRMRRLSKPKLHSYSVFPCARLAVAAVRVVELQLFGGGSLEIGNWKLKIINYLAGGHWKLEIEN